ncbi:DUF4097 family beta strand repeat-containing protein [Lysobacter sp. A3-1-A15]|uniref:DUF4097 family beta strand repeat-containing protein n=1 Tax=Novilysobacter viscosus TaxID=3098602 RepID=UPI002ED86EC7
MIRTALFSLALVAAWPALAATPIDETRPLDADGRLQVDNLKGLIEVRAWDRPEVRIQGQLGAGAERLSIDGDRRSLQVRVKYPNRVGGWGGRDRSEPTELRLMVPLQAALDIDGVAARIDVRGVASRELSIDSVSGDVTVVGAPRKAGIETVSGDQQLTLNSPDVALDTVSGDIRLAGRMDGEVDVETVSGDARVDVLESRLREFSGATVSGDVQVSTALATGAEVRMESVSGDLELRLPRDTSARVSAESFSGSIDAPGANVERPRHGPGSSLRHRYGSGDASIEIETFSGDATLRME